jgi:hypothetical protein
MSINNNKKGSVHVKNTVGGNVCNLAGIHRNG